MVKKKAARKREESMSEDELCGFNEIDDFADDTGKEKEILSDEDAEDVYRFGDSDDLGDEEMDDEQLGDDEDENDDKDDIDMGSDIEEEEKTADERAWGKSNRRFYNTDYVDQDYEGFYVGKEAEEAELEEQEARQIQKRLAEQLNDADFDISSVVTASVTTKETDPFEEIKRDVSTLTKRQKIDLLQKESPEFFILVEDFKNKLVEIDQLLPVLNYLDKKGETSQAFQFLKKKFLVLTNYCTNISFYLLLRAKGIGVQNHPVLKSLFKYRKLLEQMQELDKVMNPQIEKLQRAIKDGVEIQLDKDISREKKKQDKNILKLLSKSKTKKDKNINIDVEGNKYKEDEKVVEEDLINSNELEEAGIDGNENQANGKRAITYEMAKNKGLMPRRNKDQRNPRVKHRKKYRKALIRRRGQVRPARSEIPVYGGEASGIKASVIKSIKFK